jgi:hypothetical protein
MEQIMGIEDRDISRRLPIPCVLSAKVTIELNEGDNVLEDPEVRPVADER